MSARVEAVESENAIYEEELQEKIDDVDALIEKLEDLVQITKDLSAMVENPEPPVQFGRKGEKWTYEVPPSPPPHPFTSVPLFHAGV